MKGEEWGEEDGGNAEQIVENRHRESGMVREDAKLKGCRVGKGGRVGGQDAKQVQAGPGVAGAPGSDWTSLGEWGPQAKCIPPTSPGSSAGPLPVCRPVPPTPPLCPAGLPVLGVLKSKLRLGKTHGFDSSLQPSSRGSGAAKGSVWELAVSPGSILNFVLRRALKNSAASDLQFLLLPFLHFSLINKC